MTAWVERLAQLPAVTLAELETEYALLTRVDRKYIVSPAVWADVMAEVEGLRALEIEGVRSFGYESVYFDTPELDSYRDAARRRPARYKVRTREYLEALLGATVHRATIRKVDLLNESTVVDVRYTLHAQVERPTVERVGAQGVAAEVAR